MGEIRHTSDRDTATNAARQSRSSTTARVYRALGIFSGTQSVGILCTIARTKIVALWCEAVGIGLFGIYNAAVELISSVTQMSLRSSAVRDLASHPEGSEKRIFTEVTVKRWGLILGITGMLLTVIFAKPLASIALGDASLWPAFVMLSPVMLMGSVNNSLQAIMQADGHLRPLARSALWGSAAALISSVPLIYYFRIQGIIPVILAYSAATLAATAYYHRSGRKDSGNRSVKHIVRPSLRDTLEAGRSFMRLGFYITLSSAMVYGATFGFMSWLRMAGGDEILGYYQAGNTLLVKYAGILFTAIGMEYYPRISTVAHDRRRMATYVNHEILLLLRVAVPLALVFVAAAPWIVELLYKKPFVITVPMVTVGTIGLIARIAAWCMSFMIIARGDGRIYILTETVSTALFVVLSVAGFKLMGLTGLGVAFTAWYVTYMLMTGAVCRVRYGLRLKAKAAAWLLAAFVLTGLWAAICLAYRC